MLAKTVNQIRTEDISKALRPLLTEEVQRAFEKQVTKLKSIRKDGSVEYVCRFFGIEVREPTIGIWKLASILNEIAQSHKFLGALSAGVSLPTSSDTFYILAYVAFSAEDAIKLEGHPWQIWEGDTPRRYLETPEDIEKLNKEDVDAKS